MEWFQENPVPVITWAVMIGSAIVTVFGGGWLSHRLSHSSRRYEETIKRLEADLADSRTDVRILKEKNERLEDTREQLEDEKAGLAEELKASRAETERTRNDPGRKVLHAALKPIRGHIDVYCVHIRKERALPPLLEQWKEKLFEGCRRWMRKDNLQFWEVLGAQFERSDVKALKNRILSLIDDHCSDRDDEQDSTLLERAENLLEEIRKLEGWSPY